MIEIIVKNLFSNNKTSKSMLSDINFEQKQCVISASLPVIKRQSRKRGKLIISDQLIEVFNYQLIFCIDFRCYLCFGLDVIRLSAMAVK